MRRGTFLIIPVALALGACSLSRDSPEIRHYVLGGTSAGTAHATPPDASGVLLGVRRLDLTPYLASPSIVVRRGEHQVLTSDYHRWGEDPVAGINRAFAGHLAAAPRVRAVDVAPWPVRSQHDFVVQLHVSRFEGVIPEDSLVRHGEAHLAATWELSRPQEGRVVARGSTDYRGEDWIVGDYASLVALLDRGLNRLAEDVVACIGRLAASVPPAIVGAVAEQPLMCESPEVLTGRQ